MLRAGAGFGWSKDEDYMGIEKPDGIEWGNKS